MCKGMPPPDYNFEPWVDDESADRRGSRSRSRSGRTPSPRASEGEDSDPDIHEGVSCSACSMCPLVGTRYKCSSCPDASLCKKCYKQKDSVHEKKHRFYAMKVMPYTPGEADAKASSVPKEAKKPKEAEAPNPKPGPPPLPLMMPPLPMVPLMRPVLVPQLIRTCPAKHKLVPHIVPCKGACDVCGRVIEAGMQVLDCRPCNWYTCDRCHSPHLDIQAVPGLLPAPVAGLLPGILPGGPGMMPGMLRGPAPGILPGQMPGMLPPGIIPGQAPGMNHPMFRVVRPSMQAAVAAAAAAAPESQATAAAMQERWASLGKSFAQPVPEQAQAQAAPKKAPKKAPEAPKAEPTAEPTPDKEPAAPAAAEKAEEAPLPGQVLIRGQKCHLCQQKSSDSGFGVTCHRSTEEGELRGCLRGVCWDCMRRASVTSFGASRLSKAEWVDLKEGAWWMHEKCMSDQDKADFAFLAEGWIARKSKSTGKVYYVNERKFLTQWELPELTSAPAGEGPPGSAPKVEGAESEQKSEEVREKAEVAGEAVDEDSLMYI